MLRLNKYISNCGVCSRRKADELIETGKITVNGEVVREFGTQIDEEVDIVCLLDRKIELEKKKVYIMLNKPKGYITTNDEQFGRPSIVDLIHEVERVFPIGRLDMYTEGLLLLTNDGEFANKLMHPKNKIEKTYIVKVDENISSEKIEKLQNGVDIGDYITKPAKVRMKSDTELEIKISEGKNRQIRKMCEIVDIIVLDLKRTKIGSLKLGNLKSGEYRKLNPEEVERL